MRCYQPQYRGMLSTCIPQVEIKGYWWYVDVYPLEAQIGYRPLFTDMFAPMGSDGYRNSLNTLYQLPPTTMYSLWRDQALLRMSHHAAVLQFQTPTPNQNDTPASIHTNCHCLAILSLSAIVIFHGFFDLASFISAVLSNMVSLNSLAIVSACSRTVLVKTHSRSCSGRGSAL